jgi:trehalose-6-phosphatase
MFDPRRAPLTQLYWLFDYDGSVCPHREEWEFGEYNPEKLCQILDALAKRSLSVMWNTGRSVESLSGQSPHYLKFKGFFEHAAFFWDGNKKVDLIHAKLSSEIVDRVVDWAQTRSNWLRLEFKSHSLRVIPLQAQDRSRLRAEFLNSELSDYLDQHSEVYTSEGWRAFEVLLSDAKKTKALSYLMRHEPSFAGALPVVVGDDLPDAGIVRDALAMGGYAFLVGSHCGWLANIPHKSSQVAFFSTPQELLNFLERMLSGELVSKISNKNPAL